MSTSFKTWAQHRKAPRKEPTLKAPYTPNSLPMESEFLTGDAWLMDIEREREMNSDQNHGGLVFAGAYTTRLYKRYNKPLQGSLLSKQYKWNVTMVSLRSIGKSGSQLQGLWYHKLSQKQKLLTAKTIQTITSLWTRKITCKQVWFYSYTLQQFHVRKMGGRKFETWNLMYLGWNAMIFGFLLNPILPKRTKIHGFTKSV